MRQDLSRRITSAEALYGRVAFGGTRTLAAPATHPGAALRQRRVPARSIDAFAGLRGWTHLPAYEGVSCATRRARQPITFKANFRLLFALCRNPDCRSGLRREGTAAAPFSSNPPRPRGDALRSDSLAVTPSEPCPPLRSQKMTRGVVRHLASLVRSLSNGAVVLGDDPRIPFGPGRVPQDS